jgi:hypothetical protein
MKGGRRASMKFFLSPGFPFFHIPTQGKGKKERLTGDMLITRSHPLVSENKETAN